MIVEGTGSLFDASVEALVNPVNTVGVMGKGLAAEFKMRFPTNFLLYARACARGEVRIGKVFVASTGAPTFQYILNFPTKPHWREPSQVSYIREGLIDLVAQVQHLKVQSLAVPALGCGNGGLSYKHVRPLLEQAFQPFPAIRVVLFPPL